MLVAEHFVAKRGPKGYQRGPRDAQSDKNTSKMVTEMLQKVTLGRPLGAFWTRVAILLLIVSKMIDFGLHFDIQN